MNSKASALVMGVGPEQGLGAALCKRFAEEQIQVFVCGRTKDKVNSVCSSITSQNGNAVPIVTDVTEINQVEDMINIIRDSQLPLELAVYNAGNNLPQKFLDVTADTFTSMWEVLCLGGFLT